MIHIGIERSYSHTGNVAHYISSSWEMGYGASESWSMRQF
jgi:hypothetical protein